MPENDGVRPSLSRFAQSLQVETAFTVLAVAKRLKAAGKDVVELEIGDSPFESTACAKEAGILAIRENQTHYAPSPGLPEFREAAAEFLRREFDLPVTSENIVIGPGAKVFEQFFCETFLNPGDSVLVFSPHFPTYGPNIERRGARVVLCPLREENAFRPQAADVARFLDENPSAKAVFLNSPHNPTGGVMRESDAQAIAEVLRGRDIAVFSDEPYCHMVWQGRHHSILAQPGMLEQGVAAYTFSKSYSMSGWRLGFAAAAPPVAETIAKMINTSLSCTAPFAQMAGMAALQHDQAERDRQMQSFRRKVERLVQGLSGIEGIEAKMPAGTFYVFPNVQAVCRRLGITSHGLAMYLLEGADDDFGVACLGGECFGPAGAGFLRFSCAEPDERLDQAASFIGEAIQRQDRVEAYLTAHPQYRLKTVSA